MIKTIARFRFWKKFTKNVIIGSSLLVLSYLGVQTLTTFAFQKGPETVEANHERYDSRFHRGGAAATAIANSRAVAIAGGSPYQGTQRYAPQPIYYHQPVQYPTQYPTSYPTRVVYNDPVTYNYDYDITYRNPQPAPMPTYRSDCRPYCYGGGYTTAPPAQTVNYWAGWNPNQYPGGAPPTNYWADWDPNRYPTY
jgi:hypothetical protein